MAQMRVDAATLHKAAGDVRSTRGEAEGELRQLASLAGNLRSAWQGQAGGAFQSLMERFNTDAQKLLEALGGIADTLDESGNQHTANDEQQQQSMSSITAALG